MSIGRGGQRDGRAVCEVKTKGFIKPLALGRMGKTKGFIEPKGFILRVRVRMDVRGE